MAAGTFRDWLSDQIRGQQISRRALAKRLAAKHPEGVTTQTVETYRRAIYKYLDPVKPADPSPTTRRAFAEALGISPDELPDDEEEPDLAATLQDLARAQAELARLSKQIKRALTPGPGHSAAAKALKETA